MTLHHRAGLAAAVMLLLAAVGQCAEGTRTATVRISFGHQRPWGIPMRLVPGSPGLSICAVRRPDGTAAEVNSEPIELQAGGGRVETIECDVTWPPVPGGSGSLPQDPMWRYLLEHGTPGQVARLKDDPGLTPGAPLLTVQAAEDGTRGFTLGLQQLLRHRAMWLPEYGAFVTLADADIHLDDHLATLQGQRTLDRVKQEPEATLADFTSRWEDLGDPVAWSRPWESSWLGTRGHIIPLAGRHGTLYKFGIDRWGSVRPDLASPHKFRFDPLWPGCRWSSQRLTDGLPVIVTALEREGQHCELEQFTAPRDRGRPQPRGEDPMVMFTRATISGAAGPVQIGLRLATESKTSQPEVQQLDGRWCVVDRQTAAIWLMIEPGEGLRLQPAAASTGADPAIEVQILGRLAAGEVREFLIKLPSPPASRLGLDALKALDFDTERAATVQYWEKWLAGGARFEVPEAKVNELFRANLWHALRLPRFRVQDGQDRIDLPYSNFAYGQRNADWPINQAVYVDYMLYGLRGHFAVAEQELAAMFQTQQRPDGRIRGYADWGVYSPSMLYAVGNHYLLSRDRESFQRLLPAALRTMDWCLSELARAPDPPAEGQPAAAANAPSQVPGLIVAPLNDLTHDARAWGFPQAYFVGGLAVFGHALQQYGHPRAAQCAAAAARLAVDVERAFSRGSVRSPVVQLADGTWSNYVPSAANTPRRLFDQWYPTDVDTGPLHMARLGAIDPRGWLSTAMLHDHEDNLFFKQWGAANEPVYNQQGTVYLLRDEPEAAIRTFYTTLACAFSHGQVEPVEHRWAWGQYFGPPSTDGAWFDLYRHMLLHETDDGGLLVAQATPRAWLEDGKQIVVQRAPTFYGPVDVHLVSRAAAGRLEARVEFAGDRRPGTLLVRLRHPQKKPLRSVTVNGQPWDDFDGAKEWVRIPAPTAGGYELVADY